MAHWSPAFMQFVLCPYNHYTLHLITNILYYHHIFVSYCIIYYSKNATFRLWLSLSKGIVLHSWIILTNLFVYLSSFYWKKVLWSVVRIERPCMNIGSIVFIIFFRAIHMQLVIMVLSAGLKSWRPEQPHFNSCCNGMIRTSR